MMYRIPVDLIVQADTAEHALGIAQEEMDWLCGLDNLMCAVQYPSVDKVKEEKE